MCKQCCQRTEGETSDQLLVFSGKQKKKFRPSSFVWTSGSLAEDDRQVEKCKAGAATAAAEHLLLAFQSMINISIYPNIALLGRQCCLGLFNCYSWHSCTPVCNARCEFLMGSTRLFPPLLETFSLKKILLCLPKSCR